MLMPGLLIKIRHQHENVYSVYCSYEPKYPKVLAYLREILLMMKAPKCEYLMT
jgi:hypothetical protein